MSKYVMGSFKSVPQAKQMVDQLISDGYPADSISVVADRTLVLGLDEMGPAFVTDYDFEEPTEGEAAWTHLKKFFMREDQDDENYKGHWQDIRNGSIVVTVDKDKVPEKKHQYTQEQDSVYWLSVCGGPIDVDDTHL
ncbi:MAG: hypothetical protein GXY32_07940 [Ruminococcaceae bacterium]|nr:hypothetical protein [Oscillospiraceae bacterium]